MGVTAPTPQGHTLCTANAKKVTVIVHWDRCERLMKAFLDNARGRCAPQFQRIWNPEHPGFIIRTLELRCLVGNYRERTANSLGRASTG